MENISNILDELKAMADEAEMVAETVRKIMEELPSAETDEDVWAIAERMNQLEDGLEHIHLVW